MRNKPCVRCVYRWCGCAAASPGMVFCCVSSERAILLHSIVDQCKVRGVLVSMEERRERRGGGDRLLVVVCGHVRST